MKKHEGNVVFLRPTGNNARRSNLKIIKAKIIKVARVNVTMLIEGHTINTVLKYRGNELYSEHNSGYVVYESQKDLDDYHLLCKLSLECANKLQYVRHFESLGLDKIKAILNILDDIDI